MENLTPPANGNRQRRPCHAGTLPAGTVAPGSVPAPAARHRNGEQTTAAHDMHRDAPGAAPPRQRRPKARAAAHTAPPALAFFFCPSSSPAACPACRISSPARAGRCAAPGKSWKVPGERWAQYPDITPTACTGKDQHRQRRTDDPAAHQLHRLPIACTPAPPDLTAAASAHRLHPSAAAHPAALPPACRSRSAPPTTAKRPKTSPPRPAAGGVRFFTYPAYRLCSIAVS